MSCLSVWRFCLQISLAPIPGLCRRPEETAGNSPHGPSSSHEVSGPSTLFHPSFRVLVSFVKQFPGYLFAFRIDEQGKLSLCNLFQDQNPKSFSIEHSKCLATPQFSSVQFSSVDQSCPTLCDPMNRSTPGLPVHHQLSSLKLTSIESVMPSSRLILCCPLFLLPPIPPSIRVFSNESTLHMRWPK